MDPMKRIDQLMSSTPMTASRRDLVGTTRDLMLKTGVHCFPVIDATGHPEGIVSSWDLMADHLSVERIEDVMTCDVITIGAHQSVYEAASTMQSNFIHHLVVTNADDEVVGVVSSFDLLAELTDEEQRVPEEPTPSEEVPD